jgi:pilus assembly protein CpaB
MTAAVRGLEGSRTILRRRALPSGRAVAGGFLMALAALGVFVAARGAGARPTQNYVVVAHEVIAGTTLTDDDLTFAALDLPGSLASHAFTSRSSVVGQVAIAHLSAGDLVQSSVVVAGDAADQRMQLSIPVERARALDGLLEPGERVDVLATYPGDASGETIVVARGAEVRRVDNGSRSALSASDNTVLVLAVDDPDAALAVAHASQAGKVTIVRATGAPDQELSSSYQPPEG